MNCKLPGAALALFLLCTQERAVAQSALDTAMQPLLGTLSVRFEPYLAQGKLKGCTMVFNHLMMDDKYDLGAYLKITGNFGILATKNGIASNLKVAVNKVTLSGGKFEMEPRKPTRAYLMLKDFTTTQGPETRSFDGETPGSIFVVFDAARGLDFAIEIMKENVIDLGFNQANGASDLRTSLDFSVVDFDPKGARKRTSETIESFSSCVVALKDKIQ